MTIIYLYDDSLSFNSSFRKEFNNLTHEIKRRDEYELIIISYIPKYITNEDIVIGPLEFVYKAFERLNMKRVVTNDYPTCSK